MVWVVLRSGETLSAPELVDHCGRQMASYMLPRYVQFADSLPKTPTEKVEKYKLVERGVSAETWDRENT